MAYDSTQVPVDRTQAKIRALLMAHGAIGIAFVSQPPREGFTTSLAIEGRPYIVTKNGMTVGEHILPQLDKAVDGNPLRMLPARSAVAE